MPSNKLENLLNPSKDGDLGSLISRAQQMGKLTNVLCSSLPESDQSAIVAANVREDGELIIMTSSCKQPKMQVSRRIHAAFVSRKTDGDQAYEGVA